MTERLSTLVFIVVVVVVELAVLALLVPPTSYAYLYIALMLIIISYIHIRVLRYFLARKISDAQIAVPEFMLDTERLLSSLAVAEKIQKYLLPANTLSLPGIEIYSRSRPSEEIGGDFYQVIPLSGNKTLIAIGDAAGHGLPSAMVGIMVDTLLHAFAHTEDLPEILARINAILYERIDPTLFSTLLLLIWDDERKEFAISSAGFGRFMHYVANEKRLDAVKSGGVALGMIPDITQKIDSQVCRLDVADALILCTDGILDMRDPYGKKLGSQAWADIVKKHANTGGSEDIFNNISNELLSFANTAKQVDDITLMIIRRTC